MLAASPLSLSETHGPMYGEEAAPAEKGDAAQSPDVMIDCLRDDSSVEGSPLGKRKAEMDEEDGSTRKKSQSPARPSGRASPNGSAGSQHEVRRSRRLTAGRE